MMDTAGAFVGVLIAGLAMWLLKDQSLEGVCRVVFLFAAFIAALSWGTTFLLEREHQSKDTQGRDTASSSSTLSGPRPISVLSKESFFNLSRFGKKYWQVVGVLILFALANSSDTFLLLKASDIGLSPVAIVMIYALYNISYSLFSFPAGKLSDRFGRWTLIASGWLVYAAVYALISVSDSASIWGIFRGYGLYMALTEGVSKALIIDSVPSDLKGAALGILYLLLGLTSFSSNIIAGYAWDNISKDSPFLIGSTFALIATFFALMLGRKERI
jgi:sugar phosphate permease